MDTKCAMRRVQFDSMLTCVYVCLCVLRSGKNRVCKCMSMYALVPMSEKRRQGQSGAMSCGIHQFYIAFCLAAYELESSSALLR